MTGNDQRLPAGTIVQSPLSMRLPTVDVTTYVFSRPADEKEAPLYFNPESPSQNYSLREAEVYVKRIAKGLQNLRLQKGDRVLLYAGNKLFFPIVLWSTIAAGCVFTGSSPAATASELEYQLKNSGARVVLTSQEGIDTALKAAAGASLPQSHIFAFGDLSENLENLRVSPWTSFWASSEDAESWNWQRISTFEEANQTTAVLNYSSGTTGLPKGVEISHYNIVANSEQLLFKRSHYGDTPEAQRRKQNIELLGERWLAALPMYHAYGQTYYCLSAARLGAKVYIMPVFSLEKYLLFMDIYRITFMASVPTIMTMLHKYEKPDKYNLRSVEVVTSGSAPLDGDMARSVTRKYLRAGVIAKQGWGMTETTCSVTGFSPDDHDDGRSVGWLNPNCAAKIVPEGDEESANSSVTTGELWVSGPQMMKGYWKNENATKETVVQADGHRWIRTGDLAYIDTRGCIYIFDRLKELIKVKGLQVAPAELQLALVTHPSIEDAAVVGCQIQGQEHPRAFIVQKAGEKLDAKEVFDFIKTRFARHKWLTGGVYFIEAIPRTPSGKVKKRDLPNILQHRPSKL